MIQILCAYLKGLNNENINFISNTIMNNFILYKQKMIVRKLNNIFNIYTKQELLSKKYKLLKWQQNTLYDISKNQTNIDFGNNLRENYFHLNLNVGPIMNNSTGVPIIINNNSNHSNTNNNNINTSNINNSNINNSHINNEIDFKNSLNRNNKNALFRNNYSTINNSSSNFSSIQKLKQRPYSSEILKRIPNDNKIYKKKNNNKYCSDKIVNKFIKRQEKYIKTNSQKKQKIIKDNEEEYRLIYTFEPKVNESLRKLYKKDKISASKRLYNDSIIRKNKILEKQNSLNNTSKILIGKSFNQNKYIELYEDSKIRKDKKEELIKKIEKECGYTYAPTLSKKHINIKKNGEDKKNTSIKKIDNNSFNKINNKENNIKKLKKIEKNKSCNKLITLKKKEIKKNKNININNNGNKINGNK